MSTLDTFKTARGFRVVAMSYCLLLGLVDGKPERVCCAQDAANTDESSMAAIDSAWQKLLEELRERTENRRHFAAGRFVGKLEAGCGCVVPESWSVLLCELTNVNGTLLLPLHNGAEIEKLHSGETAADCLQAKRIAHSTENEEESSVPANEVIQTILVNSDQSNYVAAHLQGEQLFIATYPKRENEYVLTCIKGSDIEWTSRILTASRVASSTGVGYHSVHIGSTKSYVFVFGESSNGLYLTILEAKSGKALARYRTDTNKT